MADQVKQAMDRSKGPILVVTGGFHSYALFARLFDVPFEDLASVTPVDKPATPLERGIALTPYSYQRLDALSGYDAGMPNPGFYRAVWEDAVTASRSKARSRPPTHRRLVAQMASALRARGQSISAADLIAVEAAARSLAALRGRDRVWRRDLVDAVVTALVKDEIAYGHAHPFLSAIHEVLRGDARGALAADTELPPLVHDIRRQLHANDLEPEPKAHSIQLDLHVEQDLVRSRLLHRVRGLGIAGFARTGGSDILAGIDTARLWEEWKVQWSPEFEATCVEAAIYGAALEDAAGARLIELAAQAESDAAKAARLLLDSRLMGIDLLSRSFYERLRRLIRQDGEFTKVTEALRHLVYLYRYDEVLGAAGNSDVGLLLAEAFERGLWLLESLGQVDSGYSALVAGVHALLEAVERCGAALELNRTALVEVFNRVGTEPSQMPVVRGAVIGALWTLQEADTDQLAAGVRHFADPATLGDYLTGLFSLAREAAQRQPDLIVSIDDLLMEYDDTEFLEALPALRLAFSRFTPREKHYLAQTLLQAHGEQADIPLTPLEVHDNVAARVLAFEAHLFAEIERYGLWPAQEAADGE